MISSVVKSFSVYNNKIRKHNAEFVYITLAFNYTPEEIIHDCVNVKFGWHELSADGNLVCHFPDKPRPFEYFFNVPDPNSVEELTGRFSNLTDAEQATESLSSMKLWELRRSRGLNGQSKKHLGERVHE